MSDHDLTSLLMEKASAGQLMSWLVADDRVEAEREAALRCLARLHRERRLDVLQHLGRREGEDEWGLDYGRWCSVYRELVPALDDTADRVVFAVVELATGIWEPTLQDAFLDWCSRDLERVDQVLELGTKPEIPDFCFAAALMAAMRTDPAAYVGIAAEFAKGARRSRMPGIRAIGAMSIGEDATVLHALSALRTVLLDETATIRDRADALTASLELAQRCGGLLDEPVAALVDEAVAARQVELLAACCHFIVRIGSQLQQGIAPSLLKAVRSLDIDTAAGRSIVDMPLYSLLMTGRTDEALSCLESLLLKSEADEPMDALGSTTHYLTATARHLLPVVICRWLLTGERRLCAAARHLLTATANQHLTFDFAPGNKEWPDIQTLYLARKAVGWLMPHATAPASFLVCLLRDATPPVAAELGELLFDPLLVNYPLATRAYLETVRQGLSAEPRACIDSVLQRNDSYKAAIEAVGFVPELQPTERHRWAEHRRQGGEWAKARSKAEEKSPLASLFTRQTMLYGIRAIGYVDDPGSGARRLENKLGTVTHTADNAMGWVYDPCGLDFVLRVFRAERKPR